MLRSLLSFYVDSCVVPYEFADSIPSCYDFYDERNEDKMGWNELLNNSLLDLTNIACTENWKYRTEEELGAHQSLGQHALYSGGGYVANLGYDSKTASAVLQDLHSNGWIDRQTRVLIVELSMFNVPYHTTVPKPQALRVKREVGSELELYSSGRLRCVRRHSTTNYQC